MEGLVLLESDWIEWVGFGLIIFLYIIINNG
jgi:hypothetical protein